MGWAFTRDHLRDAGDLQHRQDRPEHLLLHDRGVGRHVHQDRRREVAVVAVMLAAVVNVSAVEELGYRSWWRVFTIRP